MNEQFSGDDAMSQVAKTESRHFKTLGLLDSSRAPRLPSTHRSDDRSKRARQITAFAIISAALLLWALLLWFVLG